jgi:hypothetical protein
MCERDCLGRHATYPRANAAIALVISWLDAKREENVSVP